jgi:outer membrane protein
MKKHIVLLAALAVTLVYSSDELSLSGAFEEALKHEGRIRSVEYQTKAANEQVDQAFAHLLPKISASVQAGWRKYDPRYDPNNREETSLYYTASLVQPIYRPEVMATWDKAKLAYTEQKLVLRQEKQSLAKEVAKAYFDLLQSQKQLQLSLSYRDAMDEKWKQVSKAYEYRMSSKVDYLEAKVNFDQSKADVVTQQKHLHVAVLTLSRLVGQRVEALQPLLEGDWQLDTIDSGKYDRWHALINQNLDIQRAHVRVQTAKKDLKLRKYGHYPTVDAKLSYTGSASDDSTTYVYDNRAEVDVTIPLYEGGYVSSRVQEGKYLLQSSREEVAYYQRKAETSFEEQWGNYLSSYESVMVLRESIKSSQLYVASVAASQKRGLKTLYELYDAESKLLQVRQDLVKALYDLATAYIELLDVTGNLTFEQLQHFEKQIRASDANETAAVAVKG